MRGTVLWILLLSIIGLCAPAFSAEAPRISKEELKAFLDHPDLVLLDVRYGKDWTNSDKKIKGAIREDPDDLKSWAYKYSPDKTIVLY